MLTYRISPAMYGSRAAAIDSVTSVEVRLAPDQLRGGMIVVPSAARARDGRPRFELVIPRESVEDVSALLLMGYEQMFYGYEAPYRMFLDAHIEPGDVFIDIGGVARPRPSPALVRGARSAPDLHPRPGRRGRGLACDDAERERVAGPRIFPRGRRARLPLRAARGDQRRTIVVGPVAYTTMR